MTCEPPASLREFQSEYSRYLRAPHKHDLPAGVPARRSEVYERLLFNNLRGFVDKCFPVAQSMLGESHWLELCQRFYEDWQCQTPIFSRIPAEFCSFVAEHGDGAPPWLAELLHYEWLELEVDLAAGAVERVHLLDQEVDTVEANPTLTIAQYQWPVHKLSPSFVPTEPSPTLLCVYRTYDMNVRFMEINALTALLLELIQKQAQASAAALSALCREAPNLSREQIHQFGPALIAQLVQSNVLQVSRVGE